MKKKNIQRSAHAATFLAACWTLFSAFAVFDWFDGHRYIGGPGANVDFVIWGIHLLIIGVAIYCWRTEKAQEILWVGKDDEILDIQPEAINLEEEKENLKKLVISQVSGTLILLAVVALTPSFLYSASIIFGAAMLLNIIYGLIRYFVFRHKVKRT